ncbi:helix-turn-helix domain-containing protein [Arthrobacter sp. SDTb3-6]|uniref:AlbA family DNA-binding domain-containing protein n=1 Tax=Arthrobacter sp. SDTb3-6 TaxID=2713571 RepID=UPI00159E200C|nr:ATP-binding protein [Arthrobacter sp. SDTb3-6]NVN00042.1 ATP-binding protein [Arthrobacter sp. SDTb3-6]
MTNPWTSLHAALNLPKGVLTYEHIVQAVTAEVGEDAGLDWKRDLPQRGKVHETTKDIAAMANSGGGVIVYGVAEDSAGRAESISPVSVIEADRLMILSAAAAAQPMVPGLKLYPLSSSEESEVGVVVAIVPGSPNAPHLVGQKHLYGAPVRNGPTTIWLDERSIERAYAERFSLRSSRNDLLETMVEDLKDRLDLPDQTWLLGVATPLAPTSKHSDVNRQEVYEMLKASRRRSVEMTQKDGDLDRPLSRIRHSPERLKVGRRRLIAETAFIEGPDNRSEEAHVEIHHDGSVGVALKSDQGHETFRFGRPKEILPKGEYQEILEWTVESFAADIVSLAYEAMQKGQNAGAFGLRIEATRSGTQPFILVGPRRSGGVLLDPSQVGQDYSGRTIPRLHPVESEILPSDTEEDLLAIARSMALEIIEQFGAESLHYLSLPTTT